MPLVGLIERAIRDWPLRRKIWLLPVVAGVALAAIVLVTTVIAIVDYSRLQTMRQQSFPSLERTERLRGALDGIQDELSSAVVTHEVDRLTVADSLQSEFLATLAAITSITPAEAPEFELLRRDFQNYYFAARATTRLQLAGQSGDSVRSALNAISRLYGSISRDVAAANQADEQDITNSFQRDVTLHRIGWLVNGVVTLLCIAVLSIIAIALTRAVTASLKAAITVASEVAAGNMAVEISDASDDEAGQLLRAMRDMVAYLSEMSSIAARIAEGDTSVELGERSEHDQFGAAFAAMISYLGQMTVVAERLGAGDLTVAITPRSPHDRFGIAFASTLERSTAHIAGLRNTQARLLLALDVTSVRIWEWDLEDDEITGLSSVLRSSTESMSASSFLASIDPADRPRVTAAFAEASRSGGEFEVAFRVQRTNEQARWLSTRGCTVNNATRSGRRLLVAAQDITDSKQTEDTLRRQGLVFEMIKDAVLVVNADDRILDANPAATTIFGHPRSTLVGKVRPVWDYMGDGAKLLIEEPLRLHGKWEGELSLPRSDGRSSVVQAIVQSVYDQRGDLVANICIASDLSEQRQLERELMQAHKLEAIGSLAAGIAHEINTPTQYVGDNVSFLAGGLRAYSELHVHTRRLMDAARSNEALAPLVLDLVASERSLDIEYLSTEWPVAATQAREGIERIAEIVRAMKDFSHPGAIAKVNIDLNAAIRITATVCRNEWKYVADLRLDLDETIPRVACLPGEVQQVILNLIVNAAQAIGTAPKTEQATAGVIVVSTRAIPGWVEIRVSDNGPGIPDAVRARVFDAFFTTKGVGKGTGQGLSLAYNAITVKHQGTITVESVEGEGATFIVRLPAQPVAPMEGDVVEATAA